MAPVGDADAAALKLRLREMEQRLAVIAQAVQDKQTRKCTLEQSIQDLERYAAEERAPEARAPSNAAEKTANMEHANAQAARAQRLRELHASLQALERQKEAAMIARTTSLRQTQGTIIETSRTAQRNGMSTAGASASADVGATAIPISTKTTPTVSPHGRRRHNKVLVLAGANGAPPVMPPTPECIDIAQEDIKAVFQDPSFPGIMRSKVREGDPPNNTEREGLRLLPPSLDRNQPTAKLARWMMLQKDAFQADGINEPPDMDSRRQLLLSAHRRSRFLQDLVGNRSKSANVDLILQRIVGYPDGALGRVQYSTFPQLAPCLSELEADLAHACDRLMVTTIDTQAYQTTSATKSSAFHPSRPFSLERDSVLKQVTQSSTRKKRKRPIDPMKVLCMYELSGVCNDVNCPYLHQNDCVEVSNSQTASEETVERSALDQHMAKKIGVELSLLRSTLSSRWPPVSSLLKETEKMLPNDSAAATEIQDKEIESCIAATDGDYLQLGTPLSPSGDQMQTEQASGISSHFYDRYCGDSSCSSSLGAYQAKVKANPEDIRAIIVLALLQLKVEVEDPSREDVVTTENNSFQLSGTLRLLINSSLQSCVKPEDLEASLRTLSDALEEEKNTQCEELWLLFFHLGSFRPEQDAASVMETAELAVQCLRRSVRLWRQYLPLYKIPEVNSYATVYAQLLEYVARSNPDAEDKRVGDQFSVLLCDVVLQLCVKFARAGAIEEAITFVYSLLGVDQVGDTVENEVWQQQVLDKLGRDEVAIVFLALLHLVLFKKTPRWIEERGYREAHIEARVFSFSLETLRARTASLSPDTLNRALQLCRHAFTFHKFGMANNVSAAIPDGLKVVREIWVMLLALRPCSPFKRLMEIRGFAADELKRAVVLPSVLFTTAQVLDTILGLPDEASTLMEKMITHECSAAMEGSDDADVPDVPITPFGEMMHYYLIASRRFCGIDRALSTQTPRLEDVVRRLSDSVLHEFSPNESWSMEMDVSLQSEALKATLEAISVAAAESARKLHDDPETKAPAIREQCFVMMSIFQLLDQIFGPSSAIEALDLVLTSFTFPSNYYPMLWTERFLLEGRLFRDAGHDFTPASFVALFRRFLVDKAKLLAKVMDARMRRAQSALYKNDIIAAVSESLKIEDSFSPQIVAELFQICMSSLPTHERWSLCRELDASVFDIPECGLSLADIATHDGEWNQVRSIFVTHMRRCTTHVDSRIFGVLAWLALKSQNIRVLVASIQHEMTKNAHDTELWGLVTRLEIVFGEVTDERAADWASALKQAGNVPVDASLHEEWVKVPLERRGEVCAENVTKQSKINWSACSLLNMPLTLCLCEELVVLDLRANYLVEIPDAVGQMKYLRVLDVSQNALITISPAIATLKQLKGLHLSHNNLGSLPNALWNGLVNLETLDVSYNALPIISPRVTQMPKLRVLRIENNCLTWEQFQPIASKLEGCTIDIAPSQGLPTICDAVVNGDVVAVEKTASSNGAAESEVKRPAADVDASGKSKDDQAVDRGEEKATTLDDDLASDHKSSHHLPEDVAHDSEEAAVDLRSYGNGHTSATSVLIAETDSDDSDVEFVECRKVSIRAESKVAEAKQSGTAQESLPSKVGSPRSLRSSHDGRNDRDISRSQRVQHQEHSDEGETDQDTLSSRTSRSADQEERLRRVAANVRFCKNLRNCVCCGAENVNNQNQRFNTSVLCPRCIADALDYLHMQQGKSSRDDEEKQA